MRALGTRIALSCLALLTVLGSGCIEKRRRGKAQHRTAARGESAPAAEAANEMITGDRYRVTIDKGDPAKGANEPLVTIVEFSDFECPACGSLVPNLEAAFESHADDVKLVFKQYPLKMHPRAEPAARAALAAHRQGKFWEMHDLLFANQKALGDEQLKAYAQRAGVDVDQFVRDFGDPRIARQVLEETAAGRALDVNSTPTFFVNGRLVRGALSTEKITAIIDEEVALARKLMANGVARGELYAEFMKAAELGSEPSPVPDEALQQRRGEASSVANYAVPAGKDRPTRGPDDALVTIIEFGSFGCADCRKIQPMLQRVLAKYPRDVRLVYRLAPTDDKTDQDLARLAAAAERTGKFWEIHDLLYATEDFTLPTLMRAATEKGVDGNQLMAALQSAETGKIVEEDLAMLDAFRGTDQVPILFVNGRYLHGVPTMADLDALVAEERAKAQQFVAENGGQRGPDLYEKMRRESKHTDSRGTVIVGWRGLQRADQVAAGGT